MSHRARKRFGQHFLHDPGIVQRIIEAIRPQSDELIVEIGPGHGALTGPLAASGCELLLIELDRDLAARLAARILTRPSVRLREADAMRIDYAELTEGRSFRLVGNLPYNISTPLLFHVLQWSGSLVDMHFMLQKEVVERIAAKPGGKTWGRLSVMCQLRCSVEALFTVPPEAFTPRPRVQSAVVRLTPHRQPPVEISDLQSFERLVTQAFSMRRKTLRNSLRSLLDAGQIEAAGIEPGKRPEVLSIADFASLSRMLD